MAAPLAWHVRLRVGSAQRGLENTHCCEIALLASALLDSMASLVVDAAYVHHGTAAASADNINGWSEAALKRIKPKAFKRCLESALGLSIERACWCAARDGRVDAVATKLDKRLRKAGFLTSYRRIKMDEVVCRNRDCVAAGTCPHLHRSNPVRCRRQAGVDAARRSLVCRSGPRTVLLRLAVRAARALCSFPYRCVLNSRHRTGVQLFCGPVSRRSPGAAYVPGTAGLRGSRGDNTHATVTATYC